MFRAALVDNDGAIVQMMNLEDDFQDTESGNYWPIPKDHYLVPAEDNVGKGWTWHADTSFVPPPEPAPIPLTKEQEAKEKIRNVKEYEGFTNLLLNGTVDELDAFVDKSDTKVLLKTMMKVLALNMRG